MIRQEIQFLENKINFYESKYNEFKQKAEIIDVDNWDNLKETKTFRSAYKKIIELKKQLKELKQLEFIIHIKRHTHHFIKDYTILNEVYLSGCFDWILSFYKNGKEYLFNWSKYRENREIVIKERKWF